MSNELRSQVLKCFKSLHQVRKSVFKGDSRALTEGRKKINEEFKKQKHVENTDSIKELINYSKSIEQELRSCVIQAKEVAPGRYQVEITEDIEKLDNVPFNEACCRDDGPNVKKPNRKCS